MKKIAVVYTTLDSIEKGQKLARSAVDSKVAACVNIIPGNLSIYLWNDGVKESKECFLLFKTSRTKAAKLKKWLIENHPYATPAILNGEVEVNGGFFNFIEGV